ncbi:DEAD/DEAH box helicase [Aspergillus mulundensis]|uniref:Helicase n=1 Tax=Aspergillus mulundensis TaxID=1810919 RepID=A0A3D8R498_9EURO|nr:hypothetical protein DSM5745_08599 [Aspergillus mulundensis]RDW68839.1 hypothetical protein DSM5745_08599 [Aspergillus mulundensis]
MSGAKRPVPIEPGAREDSSKRLCLDFHGRPADNSWGTNPTFAIDNSHTSLGDYTHLQQCMANDGTAQEMPTIAVQGCLWGGSAGAMDGTSGGPMTADVPMMGYDYTGFQGTSWVGIDGLPMMAPPNSTYQTNQTYPNWCEQQSSMPFDSMASLNNYMNPTQLVEPGDLNLNWESSASAVESDASFLVPETTNCTGTPAEELIVITPSSANADVEMSQKMAQQVASSSPCDQKIVSSSEQHDVDDEVKGSEWDLGECDTCFGEIVATATSSFEGQDGKESARVRIRPFGNVLKLSLAETETYAGILCMPGLVTLLQKCSVELVATIFAGHSKSKPKSKLKPKSRKDAKTDSGEYCDPTVRILVYGLLDEMDAVAACLSEAGLFLQHPTTAEYRPGVSYNNPHYLLRPGGVMPRLQDLTIKEEDSTLPGSLSESEKSKIMRVFDCANHAVGGANLEIASSPRLATDLKEHQLVALSMMVERESGSIDDLRFPSLWERSPGDQKEYRHVVTGKTEAKPVPLRGGLLADEMGLGKTLSLLALVCQSLDGFDKKRPPVDYPKGTLLVTPKSTIPGWEAQITRHIKPGEVRYLVYHGSNRRGAKRGLSKNYDIVITTYETLQRDVSTDGVLHGESWYRVVLDEAHRIRNRSSQNFKAATAVKAHFRWCLTGTPIYNSLDDYCSLLSFLQVPMFGDKRSFDHWITAPMKRNQEFALQSLQDLVGATCFRRTKAMVKAGVELPIKNERIETVHLSKTDREVYKFFQAKASKAAGQINGPEQGMSGIREERRENTLAIINILRRICNAGERLLPASAVAEWHAHQGDLRAEVFAARPALGLSPASSSAGDDNNGSPQSDRELIEESGCPPSVGAFRSAKVQALLRNLAKEQRAERERAPNHSKSVVFSQWTDMLDLVAESLKGSDYQYARIDGQSSLQTRRSEIQRFGKDIHCTVMLASIASAAEGIDLTAARYIHLLEPHWNPMVEAQAVDRVHRIGQACDVTVTRYLTASSIEDYVRWIQDDKKRLIEQSLDAVTDTQLELDRHRCEKLRQFLGAQQDRDVD